MDTLIDTHCHLDAAEFDADRAAVARAAFAAGVDTIVVPAVEAANFDAVRALDARYPGCRHALGIHPMYTDRAQEADIAVLDTALARGGAVAVGEIGLDYFVEGLDRERQAWFFNAQLKLAQRHELPVLLHVRRAVDDVLKHLRRTRVPGGIAHAFNGSRQQADEFIKLGFCLGFGGAATHPRALRLREMMATLPLESIVLETDAPDIPPAFAPGRNEPGFLPRIAEELAAVRGVSVEALVEASSANARRVLPRLAG